MCETMQSSHRLRPAMALVHALLAPTASGDGAGERFCAPLPPSPHFSGACQVRLDEFLVFSSKICDIFIPLPRFMRSRRAVPLLAPSLVFTPRRFA
jgi:hypothetical protein